MMWIEINWTIQLHLDRSAEHVLDFKISNIDVSSSSPELALCFNPIQHIDSEVLAYISDESEPIRWSSSSPYRPPSDTQADLDQYQPTYYSISLNDILSKIEFSHDKDKNVSFKSFKTKFHEIDTIDQFGSTYVVTCFYETRGLKASELRTRVLLPRLGAFSSLLRTGINRLPTRRRDMNLSRKGAYRIFGRKGTTTNSWDNIRNWNNPCLIYGGTKNPNQFPRLGFAFEIAGKNPFSLTIAFIYGILGYILSHVIIPQYLVPLLHKIKLKNILLAILKGFSG